MSSEPTPPQGPPGGPTPPAWGAPPPAPPPPPPPAPPYPAQGYHGYPGYAQRPPPQRSDGRALVALLAGIAGVILGFLGLPGLVLGPIAYFLGKSSVRRIDESKGGLGGRSTAVAGWGVGIAATAIGAVASLAWLTFVLLATFGAPPV